MKTLIIIPAYNEEKVIVSTIRKVRHYYGIDDIVVINDGSTDQTENQSHREGVRVCSHSLNRGLGGALGTGFAIARLLDVDILVTLDGDGQHDPVEISTLLQPLLNNESDVVIGSRLLGRGSMPPIRKLYNVVGNVFTWIIFGVWTTDSQSGFRAFNKHAIHTIDLHTNHMEVSSEFFKEIRRNGLRFREVPIRAIYTVYSLSKGQNFFVGIKTVARLLLLRFRHK